MITLNPENNLGTLIENQFGDKYLFSANRTLIEKIDYQTLFNKELGQSFNGKDSLYVISGTDSGLLVKELLNNPPKSGSAYIFIEFPEIIELCQSQYDLKDQKRIIVTTEDKWIEEAKKIGLETYFFINKVAHIKSLATQYYHLSEYLFLKQAIDDSVRHLTWQYQTQLGGQTFVQKQLENIAENHTPAILLKDYFKGKSALILAGGPSLDNYIEWIEENQDNYLVIAVTRIARRLLQTKIKPDIFISVDPNPVSFNVSKEVFNYEKESLLIHQYHMSPMLLGNWLGINLYLGPLFPWNTKLNKINFDGVGPTVTNTAILYAIQMGIKEQILFGVDLCYSPEGYTHANGSNEHDNGPIINEIGQIVITNKGEKAETNSAYYEAITTIETLAELAKESEGQLINPSPDSATMKDVEHILIENIEQQNEQVSITAFLQQQIKQQKSSDYKVKHYKTVLKELNTAQFKVDKIEALANKGLEFNKKFFAGDGPTANFKYKLKMDKLEKELNRKSLVDYTELAKKFGINEFLHFLNPDKDREWTDEEIKQSADVYYKALRTGAIELGRNIFTAVNRTEIRLLENDQLKVDTRLIKRHLCSFDKSYLLDREIANQKNRITKNFSKCDFQQKKQNKEILEQLGKNKSDTTNNCKSLFLTFKNKDSSLSNTQRLNAISFYLLMLQNEENFHSRRLFVFAKENPELFFIPADITILDSSPNYFIQKQKIINNSLQEQSYENSSLLIQQQLENLTENHSPTIALKDCFKGKSALILSDDPSLNEHIEWIEDNQQYFIVIAIGQSANQLLKTKIKPDIFISTDPLGTTSFYDFKEMLNFNQESLLVNQNSFLPRIMGNWLGSSIYLGNLFPWNTEKNSDYLMDIGLNSINSAITFTIQMGIKQQILMGTDFSQQSKEQLEELTLLVKNSNSEFIHVSTDTLKLKNIKQKLITTIKIPENPANISEFLKNQIERDKRSDYKVTHYKNIAKELKETQFKVQKVKNIAEQCLKYFKPHLETKEVSLEKSINKQSITNVEKELSSKLLIDFTKLSKIFANNNFNLTNKESVKSKLLYYKILISGAEELSRHIETAIIQTDIRMLEEGKLEINDNLINNLLSSFKNSTILDKHSTNAKKIHITRKNILKEYYKKNKITRMLPTILNIVYLENDIRFQVARIYILEKFKPEFYTIANNMVTSELKVLDFKNEHEKAYKLWLKPSQNEHIKLDSLEVKLYNLFILKDIKAINKIITGIKLVSTQKAEGVALSHLAKGYLYELKNKTDKAVYEYGYANSDKTTESALKRIALISLNKGELKYAHNTLQILSDISPAYLPQLAELYIITKNYKDALNTYSTYLDYNPSDTTMLLKVGNLYQSQNIIDGAKFIFNKILELEPQNKMAKDNLKDIESHKISID